MLRNPIVPDDGRAIGGKNDHKVSKPQNQGHPLPKTYVTTWPYHCETTQQALVAFVNVQHHIARVSLTVEKMPVKATTFGKKRAERIANLPLGNPGRFSIFEC